MRGQAEPPVEFAPRDGRRDIVFAADDRAGALLEDFYLGYARAFVLPSERETLEGFRTCFALNGQAFAFAPGPFREVVMVVRDTATRARLGGANFFVSLFGATACVALNYVYVEPEARGRGLLREIVAAVSAIAGSFLPVATAATLQFIEVNDPLRLDPAASAADTAHSGLGQVERLAIWARLDARLIDHVYVQPPLSAEQEPDGTLALAVLGSMAETLAAPLFASHLRHFFGISVLKGHDPAATAIAAHQLDRVAQQDAIRLYPLGPVVGQLEAGASGPSLVAMARDLAG